jgi:hypothetical protein
MKKNIFFLLLFTLAGTLPARTQQLTPAQQLITNGDSLNKGFTQPRTIISGYGNVNYQRNFNLNQSNATLQRAVLFVGHTFSPKISLFTELEVEHAIVTGPASDDHSSGTGDVAMEQAFLKFSFNSKRYIIAGLFTPRIGITNENHLPVNFNGVERPQVEQLIIPTTWREIGVGFYGSMDRLPLNYSIALINGLNSENFHHDTGLAEGEGLGSDAPANNLAITASVQYHLPNIKFQVSGYMGGTVGLSQGGADSLGLNSGSFGTPLYLGEADLQYEQKGISFKALGAVIAYPEAGKLNSAYLKNTPSGMYGAYAELGYDWMQPRQVQAQFITFVRFEMLDLNSSIPSNGIYDGTQKQTHIIAGFGYQPLPDIAIKADIRLLHTGPQNTALVINPPPNALHYNENNQFLNLGVAWSF